ncbi:hypothetical protein [Janibacter cremeus]|uniref:Uncharacterized protein n=1 Tax=Janibacter cremeus TaxID=1285192 RepID=A0A852VPC2_9MICO|nr:hypothetical protein [Janibacter cremeus]NYF97558.1 hypothetical protein [Janibacter cremeus]
MSIQRQPATTQVSHERAEGDRVRRRVELLVDITSRVGEYRDGLTPAAARLTDHEAAIIEGLERHGLDVLQLREVLWGGHVLIDDPDLYEQWRFPTSRERLSSHHKNVDKRQFPDLGLKGPLVREKLHGRTKTGTWLQFEKTPAAMGHGFRLPTWNDVLHLCDYVVYRITKSNVGPWGLSRQTERRPMYLSPAIASSVPVPPAALDELTAALERVEDADDTTSASPDLARHFPPPNRSSTAAELVLDPGTRNGRGMFGAADIHVHQGQVHDARRALDEARAAEPPRWTLPPTAPTGGRMTNAPTSADIPAETLANLVDLVETGPVLLGAYTLAEIDAVGAIEHLFEEKPAPALIAEAVRSLAARNLISTDRGCDELKVRGDLGIATAVQHRSRVAIDARVTGTEPDQPWRFILMPQPEGITLEVLIDALGIHSYSLRDHQQAIERLWERLPSGGRGPADADADALLERSPHTALVTVNRWDESGAHTSTDLVLAQEGGDCHAFVRSEQSPDTLVATGKDDDEWRALVLGATS